MQADRLEQAQMAIRVIRFVGAPKNFFTFGTPYHAGVTEDFERIVADEFGGDIKSHQFIDVNGLVFDVKHHVSGSIIPHGRFTAVARERLWNLLWAEREQDGQPKASVVVRSHVHTYGGCFASRWLAVVTPALQAACTKYGARRQSGTVDWGFVTFDVDDKEHWTWRVHTAQLAAVGIKATRA